MQLRTGIEEEVELFPKRNGIVHADRNSDVMLQDTMADILRLYGGSVYRTPVLVIPPVHQGIEHTCLDVKMLRQREGECCAQTNTMQVDLRK